MPCVTLSSAWGFCISPDAVSSFLHSQSLVSSSLSRLAKSTQQQYLSSFYGLSRSCCFQPTHSHLSCTWLRDLTGVNGWRLQPKQLCRFTTFWFCALDFQTPPAVLCLALARFSATLPMNFSSSDCLCSLYRTYYTNEVAGSRPCTGTQGHNPALLGRGWHRQMELVMVEK